MKTDMWQFNYDNYRMDNHEELHLVMQLQVQPEREPHINGIRIDPCNSISIWMFLRKDIVFPNKRQKYYWKIMTGLQHHLWQRGSKQMVYSGLDILQGPEAVLPEQRWLNGICSSAAWLLMLFWSLLWELGSYLQNSNSFKACKNALLNNSFQTKVPHTILRTPKENTRWTWQCCFYH